MRYGARWEFLASALVLLVCGCSIQVPDECEECEPCIAEAPTTEPECACEAEPELSGDEFWRMLSAAPMRRSCAAECAPHLSWLSEAEDCWCQYPVDLGNIEWDWRIAGDYPPTYIEDQILRDIGN